MDAFKQFSEPIKQDISDMKYSLADLKNENERMKGDIAALKSVVVAQQKVISSFDKDRRVRNIVVRGVSAIQPLGTASNDAEKMKLILGEISPEVSSLSFDCFRLGYGTGNRPILVKFGLQSTVRLVLSEKKKLKNIAGLKEVFIGPDLSSAESKERGRIRKVYKDAVGNPDNRGKDITLKKGKLYMGGVVVDSVKPPRFLE